jgi:NAD(P)-dependent dehydrogenase (short-subunit alcohol dehydrogenase family)
MEPLSEDQVGLVPGASGGVGSAITAGLAAQGATVWMADRNTEAEVITVEVTNVTMRPLKRPAQRTAGAPERILSGRPVTPAGAGQA